jgi:hypothetical protein
MQYVFQVFSARAAYFNFHAEMFFASSREW